MYIHTILEIMSLIIMSPDPELSLQKGAYRGSVLWNKIPSEIRKLPSLNVFKTSFHHFVIGKREVSMISLPDFLLACLKPIRY